MRSVVRLVIAISALVCAATPAMPTRGSPATNPLATPAGMVRFYLQALGTGRCDLASKFADRNSRSLGVFLQDCRTIRRIAIEQITDPGYRLRPQTADYTCLSVRYTVYRLSGATSFGGWYLMERTLGPAWRIVYPLSHVTRGGRAGLLARSQCAGHLPSYVHPGAGTLISGSAFLSSGAGWIALSTSGSYLPNGSCTHGIGSNCESSSTAIYQTGDSGHHWSRLLRFATAVGPPVWIRLFSGRVGLVAATVEPLKATANERYASALFSTRDGGRHWQRFSLPMNYATETGSISFPDPRHGWLWYGGGAMGRMAIQMYRTSDGGRHWQRAFCTSISSYPSPPYGCPHPITGVGGLAQTVAFTNATDGWLTSYENGGVPDIYHTANGGVSWHRQAVGLPAGVALPTPKHAIFPSGRLLRPAFFGQIALLPETVGFYRPKPRASWSRLYVFRSTDGGRSWHSALRAPVTGEVGEWQALDARDWLFVATSVRSRQTMWSSQNGGSSWTKHPLHLPSDLVLVGLQMTSGRDGWATAQTHAESQVSASGVELLHTTDGGVHWTEAGVPG